MSAGIADVARVVVAGDWRHHAACRANDIDPELFYPTGDSGLEHDRQVAAAKAVCGRCPVRAECLAWALDVLPFGVAGGLSETERRKERIRGRRAHRRAPRAPERPVRGAPDEVAAVGRAAIRSGQAPRDVARAFGVSERTAQRWAAQASSGAAVSGRAVGSTGGNRAPHLISQQQDAQAGTRAAEGNRG